MLLRGGTTLAVAALLAAQSIVLADAHIVAWAKGMYCMFVGHTHPNLIAEAQLS